MAQINCADCLRTYLPYRYGIALLRVLMYGFSDWWVFEDERVIKEQFKEYWRDRNTRSWLIDKMRAYRRDDSFAGDFNFYYQYLENKRRKTVSATFLCFDCEKYYCRNCVSKHSGHLTFSKEDKYDKSKWGIISTELLERPQSEGGQKVENMKRKHILLHDVVDVNCGHDELDLDYVLDILVQYEGDDHVFIDRQDMDIQPFVEDLHVLNDNKKWLVTDYINKRIKIFNVKDNKMTRRIKLSSQPWGITEISSTEPSQTLIAVSFPLEKQIHIMNIHSTPAQVVSSIKVQGWCEDLAYCNNKVVTKCSDILDGEHRHSIHVIDISGEIINIIDLNNLPGIKLERLYTSRMSVHAKSETLYFCHAYNPSCVISLSLDGQVLHSVTFTDLKPALIHVDKDQNVYVMEHYLPIYKLSADLRYREIIDKDVVDTYSIRAMRFHHDKFYLASSEGPVYITQHELSRGHNEQCYLNIMTESVLYSVLGRTVTF